MKYHFGVVGMLLAASVNAAPVSSAFTYQGQLSKEGTPVSSLQDFQFGLYDASTSGSQIGTTLTLQSVSVDKGLFSVPLDFGAEAFGADARFLQVLVKPTGQAAFAALAPRVSITPAPVALTAVSAITANTAYTAAAASPASIGSAALQAGSVGWGKLSPGLFPATVAVMTADHALGLQQTGQVNFDSIVLASDAITRSGHGFTVSERGLYRIDISLNMHVESNDKFTLDINRNFGDRINFGRVSRFTNRPDRDTPVPQSQMPNILYTFSDYVTIRPGDVISLGAESYTNFSKILGFSGYRYSSMSIKRVK